MCSHVGFEWTVVSVKVTVGELKKKQQDERKKRSFHDVAAGQHKIAPLKAAKKSRHMEWRAGTGYKLIRKGIPITLASIDSLFEQGTLKEEFFFIFQHKDPEMNRNEDIPLYEAAFLCAPPNTEDPQRTWEADELEGFRYIRTQKRHLEQAYNNSGRKDKTLMWNVDEVTGAPYCVDRYAFRVQNERVVKKRHEDKKKKQKK
jgi:hypothetical protein